MTYPDVLARVRVHRARGGGGVPGMKLAALPTLRILFEPADDGESIRRITEAWDKPFAEDPYWDSYDVRFAAQRIARDGLQPELLAVAEDV